MKDMDMSMTPGLELPNGMNPKPHAKPYHTNMKVPTPCNYAAEKTDHAKVMRAVNEGK